MSHARRCISFAIVTLIAASGLCAQEDRPKRDISFGEDHSVIYKQCEGGDLSLYLFVPEGDQEAGGRSAIVFFFGGGWVGGTPDQFRQQARYLKSRGMIAVLADYRTRKSHATTAKECVADAKSAVRYLRGNAGELGIDPRKIVAAGGSAGGHIAAATATVTSFDDPQDDSAISCVPDALVLFNPVYDNGPGQWGHKTVKDFWESISPAHNIRTGMPPAIVFLGDQDKLIPVEVAQSFQDKMEQVGADSELHLYQGKGHGFFNFGRGKNQAFSDTVKKTDAFLVKHGFLSGPNRVEEFLSQTKSK